MTTCLTMDLRSVMVFGRRLLLPLDSMPTGRTYALIPHQLQPPTSTRRHVAASLIFLGSDVTTPVSELNIAQVLVTEGEYTPHTASLVLVDGHTSLPQHPSAMDWSLPTASSSGLGYSLPPNYSSPSVVLASSSASMGRAMVSQPPAPSHFSGYPADTSASMMYSSVSGYTPSLGLDFGAVQVPPPVRMPISPDDTSSTSTSYYNPQSVAISPSIVADDMPQPSVAMVTTPLNQPQPQWASLNTPVLMTMPAQAVKPSRSATRASVLAVRSDGRPSSAEVRRHRPRHPRRVPSAAASIPPSSASPEVVFSEPQLPTAAPSAVLGNHPLHPVGGPLVGASPPTDPTPSSGSEASR